ncbi:hypothetical protein ACFU46_32155 [Streptomyces griseoincarnatus]
MSEPACSSCPTPLEPAELISDGTCCRARSRFQYMLLVLVVLNLVATVSFGVLGIFEDGSSRTPSPTPTSVPPTTPAPNPTAERPVTPAARTAARTRAAPRPRPPDPTDGGSDRCGSIFDPECSDTSGGTGA